MPLPKPGSHLGWTDGDAAKVVEPSSAKKLLGWVALERPPFEYVNWLFFRADEWIKYFESVTDEIVGAGQIIVDAAGGGSFTDLQSAHDSADVGPGSKIVVTSDLTIDSTVQISKNDLEIEFRSGNKLIKGGGAPATNFRGLEIVSSCDRLTLRNAWFEGFTGAGDNALWLDASALYAVFFRLIFDANNNFEDNSNATYQNLLQIDL